jgi:hypothetical protein
MDDLETHSFFINTEDYEKYEKKYNVLSRKILNNIEFIKIETNHKIKKELNLKTEKIKSNVSIAAAITAKARIKLYRAQKNVINNGGRLLYSDTDSIFAAYKRNVLNEKHGDVY